MLPQSLHKNSDKTALNGDHEYHSVGSCSKEGRSRPNYAAEQEN
jgi:hypothetical protein